MKGRKRDMQRYIKIYSVTFRRYTNCIKDCVSDMTDEDVKYNSLKSCRYLDVPVGEDLLVTEEQLDTIRKYGGGIDSLKYVGKLLVLDDSQT